MRKIEMLRAQLEDEGLLDVINDSFDHDDSLEDDSHVVMDDDSPIVTLLNPAGGPDAYYALHGWVPAGDLSQVAILPNGDGTLTVTLLIDIAAGGVGRMHYRLRVSQPLD